jgi:DNA-binding CsgD family transcriptional regulator
MPSSRASETRSGSSSRRTSPSCPRSIRGDGRAVKLSDLVTRRQFHRLGVYNEVVIERDATTLVAKFLGDRTQALIVLEERRAAVSAGDLRALGLTARQPEVLSWVAPGKTDPEIATILRLSVRTVHQHLEHIYEKLGVSTRTAAAAAALQAPVARLL